MLPSVSTLSNNILNLPITSNKNEGVANFVTVIANFMNQIQAGSSGSPGILTFGNEAMISVLLQQNVVGNNSWVTNFVNAWQQGILAGTITPGTVTNPAWITSAVDVATLSSPGSTITTLSEATDILNSELLSISYKNNPPMPLAQAIYDAAMQLSFTCIGLGPPPSSAPIPIPFSAQ